MIDSLASQWRENGDLRGWEESANSQNGEDGILKEILRRIRVRSRYFVEFGVETGIECNCARLALAENWHGLFIESNADSFIQLQHRYQNYAGVQCARATVTPDNIEALLAANNVPTNFGVLSIDIDGNDYWVWSAISNWRPHVVIIEYNASHRPGRKWVMEENREHRWDGTDYFGASLTSLAILGRAKGYSLVATDSTGVNAFFVREDTIEDGTFIDPAVYYHYSPPSYGPRGEGHPAGNGPYVER